MSECTLHAVLSDGQDHDSNSEKGIILKCLQRSHFQECLFFSRKDSYFLSKCVHFINSKTEKSQLRQN